MPPTRARQPNLLIVYADQHRADSVGFANPQVRTPHLDALAARGTVFDQCFCQYPVCTPSRMSFLTGQYVHTHGVAWNNAGLRTAAPTFAHALRGAGYATACIGKMHFYPVYAGYGFDHMELAEQDGPGRFEDDYHRWLAGQGAVDLVDLVDQRHEFRAFATRRYHETFGAQASDLPEAQHSTTWVGDRAEAYLRHAEPPFCLWVGFVKPHHPFDPPADWLRLYREDDLQPVPGWTDTIPAADAAKRGYFDFERLSLPALRRVMAHYYATISHLDAQVGRLLRVLEARGLGDTRVIYTADHGEFLGFHHLLLKGGYLYDPLVRVPLVMADLAGGDAWRAGQRHGTLVESIDVTATLLEAAGLPPPAWLQGRSLGPVLRNETRRHREAVFAQNSGLGMAMLRTPQWKLIHAAAERDRMLFDLAADPCELRNLYGSAEAATVQAELSARLLTHLCAHTHPVPAVADREVGRATVREYMARLEPALRRLPEFRGFTPYTGAALAALEQLESERPPKP